MPSSTKPLGANRHRAATHADCRGSLAANQAVAASPGRDLAFDSVQPAYTNSQGKSRKPVFLKICFQGLTAGCSSNIVMHAHSHHDIFATRANGLRWDDMTT
ncbi:hypothetical protein HBH64_025840 [Parastagonospora nodorum]|nr:hypothetical protein HBI02_151820 [Parastagonospora nodorum]KAH4307161.1 hypothetical protein HBI01_053080 [Parastagonospora nodorum]KAH4337039.1 hypothetical protein HBI00_016720 [Parastagonospora nodorum]KAH4382772.1 hypothetical protein HBH94_061260 [Parastagonospora nodorum]KAH4471598.1 hypothetical protein HBH90_053860 [Parastagonospora nodorum]